MRFHQETKIFDPADGFAPLVDPYIVADPSVIRRGHRWWMFLAGKVGGREGIQLFSASLSDGAALSATGWTLTPDPDDPSRVAMLASQVASAPWDLKGGRHCPSYVKGWDPGRGEWLERIYYAGGADAVWGPYTIGYLEWDGTRWVEQPEPVFVATEAWEHGSVYEPNLIYADGSWKMWYVAGSNQEDYLVQGFSESKDGRTGWAPHGIFCPADQRVFDFCVHRRSHGYETVFSRVWLADGVPPPDTGLWWCESNTPSSRMSDWSRPVQILSAEDRGWRTGPWKPSVGYGETDPGRLFVFFDGAYRRTGGGAFPYVFTVGCLEMDRPA
jgi:hypothetical protein